MLVELVDYKGNPASVDAPRVIKIRRSLLADEPKNTVFVDYATNGLFARGTFEEITGLFSPHIPLAFLHAPTGADVDPSMVIAVQITLIEVAAMAVVP